MNGLFAIWAIGAVISLGIGVVSTHRLRLIYGWTPWLPPGRLFTAVVFATLAWPAFWPVALWIGRRGR